MPLIFMCAYQRKPLGGESVTLVAASYVLSHSLAQKANALRYRSYSKKILHFLRELRRIEINTPALFIAIVPYGKIKCDGKVSIKE